MRTTKRLKRLSRPKKPQELTITKYPTPSEAQIAIAFCDYVAKVHPNLSEDLIKIDNENKCSPQEGRRKKLMGKRKGASDYFYSRAKITLNQILSPDSYVHIVPKPVYFGLWLEIKSEKGKESPEQKSFGMRQLANGYQYKCVYSLDEAIKEFEDYIK